MFSLDGRYLASGSYDSTIKLWNIGSQKELSILKGHSDEVISVKFSNNGKHLVSGSKD